MVKLVFCGNVLQTLLNHKMTEMGVQNSKNKIGSNFLIIKHLTRAIPISLSKVYLNFIKKINDRINKWMINRIMWRHLYKHYSPRSWPSGDLARRWRSYFQRDGSVCDTLCLIGWIYVLHGRQHRSKLPRLVVACCLLYKHEEVLLGNIKRRCRYMLLYIGIF